MDKKKIAKILTILKALLEGASVPLHGREVSMINSQLAFKADVTRDGKKIKTATLFFDESLSDFIEACLEMSEEDFLSVSAGNVLRYINSRERDCDIEHN